MFGPCHKKPDYILVIWLAFDSKLKFSCVYNFLVVLVNSQLATGTRVLDGRFGHPDFGRAVKFWFGHEPNGYFYQILILF